MKEVLELKFNSVVNISAKIEPNSSSSTGVSICLVLMLYLPPYIIMIVRIHYNIYIYYIYYMKVQ